MNDVEINVLDSSSGNMRCYVLMFPSFFIEGEYLLDATHGTMMDRSLSLCRLCQNVSMYVSSILGF
jgi:hypothetical protein